MSTTIGATSRVRERIPGDEEATTELKLGEFDGAPSLSLSEARVLISAIMDARRRANPAGKLEQTETLVKTQDYLDVFARFKSSENVTAVATLLGNYNELEPFERSQLGTLCCETAEEAKTLVPSLTHKIADADLEVLLKEISNLRAFVE